MLTGLKVDPTALLRSEEKSGRVNALIITVKGKLSLHKMPSCETLQYRLTVDNHLSVLFADHQGSPDSQPGYDFYSRCFVPWAGVPEDPVTGENTRSRQSEILQSIRNDLSFNDLTS